ncbi:MAG: hypothetical protein IJW05_12170 [Lentisphaeria bacterium]|nr:hypothetical protein [Lentisphaeria bacterium]
MEITESQIYWILKLDTIVTMFVFLLILTAILFCIIFITWVVEKTSIYYEEEHENKKVKFLKNCFIVLTNILVVSLLGIIFIPTTEQMAMIKVVPVIANSEIIGNMSKDGKEIYQLGVDAIKKKLSDGN